MSGLLDLDLALDRILANLQPLEAVATRDLDDAIGRYLAADVEALVDVPHFDNSAMDGYAVRSADAALAGTEGLRVARQVFAGQPPGPALTAGECARIFTGAPLPPEADCVIIQEEAEMLADDRVRLHAPLRAGDYVRRAGGDIRRGAVLAARGNPIHAARVALLAAAGISTPEVIRRPRVAVVTTGDELCPPGTALQPGQIFDANGPMLVALVRRSGAEVSAVTHAGDDPATLGATLLHAASGADAVVCSGGVSVGAADHVREVLARHGAVDFWRLALKPGKPFAFGNLAGRPFFGLPGNPVSSLVTFVLLVRPALLHLAGATDLEPTRLPAVLAVAAAKRRGRRDFQRGNYAVDAAGILRVEPVGRQDSNILSSLTEGNCLIDLATESENPPAGTRVRIIPLADLLG